MSQTTATNIFGVLDNELERMHAMLLLSLQGKEVRIGADSMASVYSQIKKMQEVIMEVAKTHDPAIQEKIAEMALTGKANGN